MKFAGVDSSAVGVRCFPQIGQYIADGDSQTVRLPGRDGELFLSATQGPAEFPITVRADAVSAAASRTLLDGVAAWLQRGPAQLVFDELPDRYWTARLRGGLAWSLGAGSYRVVSNIVMRADDPHAYALTDDTAVLTAPGTVTRTKGNAPSRPTVWVTGTLTSGQSVTLNLWGKTVTLTGPLSAGEVALLDYRDYTFRVVTRTVVNEVRRNLETTPRATTAWSGSPGTGGAWTLTLETDTRWKGGVARKAVWTAAGTVTAYISAPGLQVGVGKTYVLAARFATPLPPNAFMQFGGGSAPTFSYGPQQTVDHGDGTVTLWRAGTVTAAGAGGNLTTVPAVFCVPPAVGAVLMLGDLLVEEADTFRGYFDGGYSPDLNLIPSWLGAANSSASNLSNFVITPLRNLAGKLSNLARINCPVGGGPVSWTTTGSISQVAIACNSRWI
ncbi:distal tail protein Dit [Micropruina sp.]|uniref:distal tail protein Dit n=1 Tax=Micropruina sp. TaxID=2737536 RepID=UPI0039E389BA